MEAREIFAQRQSTRIGNQLATHVVSPGPVSISQQAVCSYQGNAIFDTPEWFIPTNLMNEELPINIQI